MPAVFAQRPTFLTHKTCVLLGCCGRSCPTSREPDVSIMTCMEARELHWHKLPSLSGLFVCRIKTSRGKLSHPHVPVWAIVLSDGFRGFSERIQARNPKPLPRGPRDRNNSFSLEPKQLFPHARKKNILAWNLHSWFENFHSRLRKFQSRGACFSAAREGLG